MAEQAKARFLTYSWLRQGLLAGLGNDQALVLKRDHLSLPLTVSVNAQATSVNLDLYGPGDVTGIDRSEIIRIEPAAGSGGFEPNLFPLIEFDRPDFPWLFTPAAAGAGNTLSPWLCLVAIPQARARLAVGGEQLLPRLTCPRGELPDLREAWAWAHAQVTPAAASSDVPGASELSAILASQPQRNLSRLICPRRLQAETGYLACLVPVYECGRRSGLGLPPVDDQADPLAHAWNFDPRDPSEVELPVYFHWYFNTGSKGDFELLASQLKPLDASPSLGVQPIDVSAPGWGMPSSSAQPVLDFQGPLLADGAIEGSGPAPSLQEALRALLNLNADADGAPILTPPLYGQHYLGLNAVPAPSDPPGWFAELNLDPRYRAAAGLGADVIRREQDRLVAEAWEQLAAHYQRTGNAALAGSGAQPESLAQTLAPPRPLERIQRARLAAELSESLKHRQLSGVNAARMLQLTGMQQEEGGFAPPETFSRLLTDSQSAAFRRLTRSGGPLSGRLRRLGQASPGQVFFRDGPASPQEPAMALQVRAQFRALDARGSLLRERIKPGDRIRASLEKEHLAADSVESPGFAPRFERPMYETLRTAHRDLFLPGYQSVANESVTLLQANQRFIEAYMAGLNHEMGRELLWRGYPSPADATYFTRFWDRTGCMGATADDIQPLADWNLESRLGDHGTGSSSAPLVLLVRGELMRRYPRALVYAVQAGKDPSTQERRPLGREAWPSFRASLDADQLLFGFDLKASQVSGGGPDSADMGWFFIIQEQPTEPRFGLDEAAPGPHGKFTAAQASWRNLSWAHLDAEPADGRPRPYLWLETSFKDLLLERAQWGKSSAAMAFIVRQKPFRVAIHGSVWVPPPA